MNVKHTHKQLLVAAALVAFGITAGAQTPSQPAPGGSGPAGPGRMMDRGDARGHADPGRMQQHMARMQEHMARRLAQFKQKLQLSPAQDAAWNSYIAALKPSGSHKRMDREEFARLSTPERIDRMRARRAERNADMDRRGEATKAFYAALNPQQRKLFDDATARRGGRGEGGRDGGHHGRHHRG